MLRFLSEISYWKVKFHMAPQEAILTTYICKTFSTEY